MGDFGRTLGFLLETIGEAKRQCDDSQHRVGEPSDRENGGSGHVQVGHAMNTGVVIHNPVIHRAAHAGGAEMVVTPGEVGAPIGCVRRHPLEGFHSPVT